jgi:CRISPR-associated endonuclease/helicase Cas3
MSTLAESKPIAHVIQTDSGSYKTHELEDHLREVGRLASEFASAFQSRDWASIAGIWHDLGKYSKEFQDYIKNAAGIEGTEAHIETGSKGRVNHSTVGALLAVDRFGLKGRVISYLIAGHHAGIPDWNPEETGGASLEIRMNQRELINRIPLDLLPSDISNQNEPGFQPPGGKAGFHLWVRMLYSCLVDADFLDTQRFMNPSKFDLRGRFSGMRELLELFEGWMKIFRSDAPHSPINNLRAEILATCIRKSELDSGLFLLEVPTGGGKTLSSMAFALHHAIRFHKRRIIYVIPFTSIIEQTADIFRRIFGENVIEHHSNVDPDQENAKSQLASENWDAPIIVTTNVQFFESLFSARSSRCRKLHNIVDSVVILDEAQLLPPEFLQPILDVMNLLMKHYGITVLLSTATQPALSSRSWFDGKIRGMENPDGSLGISIMDDPARLYERMERVSYQFPLREGSCREWPEIASELAVFDSVLCVVNTRKDCRDLHGLMPSGTIHLSALMCGAHRSAKIGEIRDRLRKGESIRVVSTQLVEAGVDIDFPVVYRAMSGLDSIVQAAGRCNREGKLEKGRVVVFRPPHPSPPGLLRKAEDSAKSILYGREEEPLQREEFKRYYELFYSKTNLDKHDLDEFLRCDERMEVQFRSAAKRFQLIDDASVKSFYVLFGEGNYFIDLLKRNGPESWLLRKLQRFTVSVSKYAFEKLTSQGKVLEVSPGYYAQGFEGFYSEDLGVLLDEEIINPVSLVI